MTHDTTYWCILTWPQWVEAKLSGRVPANEFSLGGEDDEIVRWQLEQLARRGIRNDDVSLGVVSLLTARPSADEVASWYGRAVKKVVLTVRLPATRVLLFDRDLLLFALNQLSNGRSGVLRLTRAEDEADDDASVVPDETARASWDAIFDLDMLRTRRQEAPVARWIGRSTSVAGWTAQVRRWPDVRKVRVYSPDGLRRLRRRRGRVGRVVGG
jgi:hypothetical protein